METLKQYVYKNLEMYDRDKQSTIKCVLHYMKADNIYVSDYCNLYLDKSIEEISSKELIRHMVLNSPWGFSYKKENNIIKSKVKKRVLSFNEDFENDEILND